MASPRSEDLGHPCIAWLLLALVLLASHAVDAQTGRVPHSSPQARGGPDVPLTDWKVGPTEIIGPTANVGPTGHGASTPPSAGRGARAACAQTVLYVDARGCEASPWPNVYTHLQDALDRARAIADQCPVEIWVAAGVYKADQGADQTPGDRTATFQLINNVSLYGGFAGGETQRDQREWTINETILSGDLAGDDTPTDCAEYSNCCVEHYDTSCDNAACQALVCEDLPECCGGEYWEYEEWSSMCANRARYYCGEQFYGNRENSEHIVTASGTDASAVLDGFTVMRGYADGEGSLGRIGGGLLNDGGKPVIANCVFRENTGAFAGGIAIRNGGDLTLINCTFTGNFDKSGGGVGLDSRDSDPVLQNCTFVGELGGAMTAWGNPTLTNCTFINNDGGGLYTWGDPVLTDCRFIGNRGSGLRVTDGYAVLSGCTFSGNKSRGISIFYAGATLTNCAFFGNGYTTTLKVNTGAVVVANSTFSHAMISLREAYGKLTNCTISGTHGRVSGFESNATLDNCILWWGASYLASGEPDLVKVRDGTLTINNSCVQGWTGELGGIGNIGDDPMLIDAAGPDGIYGTEDDNLRLASGSPAINAGDTSALPPDLIEDLDGNPRVAGPAVDMGAYEGPRASFLVSVDTLTIPEGGTASFTVALSMDPIDPIEVSVSAQSGDPDIEVFSGATLAFDSDNYSTPQSVTLSAAEDIDFTNGTTSIHIAGAEIALGHLNAVEADNDPVPTVVYVDANASGANLGTGWANAFIDLHDALAAAKDRGGVSEIWVADGTYKPSVPTEPLLPPTVTFDLADGVAVYGGFAGWETSLDQRSPRDNATILSGDLDGDDGPGVIRRDDNSYNVVTATETGPGTRLDGFVIASGNGYRTEIASAGGMLSWYSDVAVANCLFTDNRAYSGAGLRARDSNISLVKCVYAGNTASSGGGVWIRGGHAALRDCVFTGNTGGRVFGGGGLYLYHCPDATLSGCVFSNNRSKGSGAAIMLDSATPILTDCILWGNQSDHDGTGEAGQIYAWYATINYSCVEGWSGALGGIGNTGADPLFVDALGPDGVAGTLDDDLRLSLDSPLINAGDPGFVAELDATDLDGNPRIQGCRVDMGAYESDVTQALGDFDGNEDLNLADIAGFQLCMDPSVSNPAWLDACLCVFDYDDNSQIDLADFTGFTEAFVNP